MNVSSFGSETKVPATTNSEYSCLKVPLKIIEVIPPITIYKSQSYM
jgi:hypothetical protein